MIFNDDLKATLERLEILNDSSLPCFFASGASNRILEPFALELAKLHPDRVGYLSDVERFRPPGIPFPGDRYPFKEFQVGFALLLHVSVQLVDLLLAVSQEGTEDHTENDADDDSNCCHGLF